MWPRLFVLRSTTTVHAETIAEALEPFFVEGLVAEVLYPIKSGKEATVYCCRAGEALDPSTGSGQALVAAKIYKPRSFRSFRNDAVYREGRVILDARSRRAASKLSGYGREVRSALWTDHEFSTLQALYAAGADVPAPLAHSSGGMLLEFIGDQDGPAPVLKDVVLEPDQAAEIFDRLLSNVELWLGRAVVHGDLSAYNVLWHAGEPKVIDFPQAVDPRFNPNAYSLLLRDLENLGRYFARSGVTRDLSEIGNRLWDDYFRR
jgi:RIO kinase 1